MQCITYLWYDDGVYHGIIMVANLRWAPCSWTASETCWPLAAQICADARLKAEIGNGRFSLWRKPWVYMAIMVIVIVMIMAIMAIIMAIIMDTIMDVIMVPLVWYGHMGTPLIGVAQHDGLPTKHGHWYNDRIYTRIWTINEPSIKHDWITNQPSTTLMIQHFCGVSCVCISDTWLWTNSGIWKIHHLRWLPYWELWISTSMLMAYDIVYT